MTPQSEARRVLNGERRASAARILSFGQLLEPSSQLRFETGLDLAFADRPEHELPPRPPRLISPDMGRMRAPTGIAIEMRFLDSPVHENLAETLVSQLYGALEETPFEMGIDHAAETILRSAWRVLPDWSLADVLRQVVDASQTSSVLQDVLVLISRMGPIGDTNWRTELIRNALTSSQLTLRQSAARAAYNWAEPQLIGILRDSAAQEQVRWLAQYMREISDEIERRNVSS